jgi:hypothetical protein
MSFVGRKTRIKKTTKSLIESESSSDEPIALHKSKTSLKKQPTLTFDHVINEHLFF